MNWRSIRFRLTAWYTAILAATFAVAGVGVWLAIRASIQETVDRDLRTRAQLLSESLDREKLEDGVAEVADEMKEQAATTPAGPYLRIADRSGHWIYSSPGAIDWPLKSPRVEDLPARGRAQNIVVKGKSIRVLSAPLPPGVVQIGAPIDEFDDMLSDLRWTLVFASPLLLVLASVGGYWMGARALRPVDQIARTARRISAQNLSERLPLRKTGDELDRLSTTLNEMLAGLEAAFTRITQFTADASHELRTPVAVMQTTAEVIRSKPRTVEEHEKAWELVMTQTDRTSRLIDDLLLLARADAGSDDLVFEAMDLAETLREAVGDMRIIAEASGLLLLTQIPAECMIRGDRDALRRLFLIFLDNAIKYTQPSGQIRVGMEIENGFGRRTALIEVQDTGMGISSEDLPRVFDRFYRAAKDRSRKTGGAGLGLSIAQWIATRHNGEILVDSTPGIGSTFRLILPLSS